MVFGVGEIGAERAIYVLTETGVQYYIPSVNTAAHIIDISRKTIERVLNYDGYVSVPDLDTTARFFEKGVSIQIGSPYVTPYDAPELDTGLYNTELQPGVVYAFNAELQ